MKRDEILPLESFKTFEEKMGFKMPREFFGATDFSLYTGDDAVLDDPFSYQVYNFILKNHAYSAAALADKQDGMLGMLNTNGVVYGQHGSLDCPIPNIKIYNWTADQTLTTAHLNAHHTMNHADAKTITFPSITAAHIGYWFSFSRLGAGKLTLQLVDSDVILCVLQSSSAGGTFYNQVDQYATIYMEIITATQYLVRYMNSTMWIAT
jgi:hypothetical protein